MLKNSPFIQFTVFHLDLQLYVITMVATLLLYFGIAGGSYFFMCKQRHFSPSSRSSG
jgi:hypothetical protein